MTRGILTIAFGKEYDELAANTMKYSRQFTDLPICVLTNIIYEERCKLWHDVNGVTFVHFYAKQENNRIYKLAMTEWSLFDETLYIDCDSVIQKKGVESVFDFMNEKDDLLVLDLYMYWSKGSKVLNIAKKAMKVANVKLPFSVYCGGFICWKASDVVDELFSTWFDIWNQTGMGREMFELSCAIAITPIRKRLRETFQERHGFFAPMNRNPDCIIQHVYIANKGRKDFWSEFNIPKLKKQCKPFDGKNKDDWHWVDFD